MGKAFFALGVGLLVAAFVVVVGVVGSDGDGAEASDSEVALVGPVWQWEEFLGNDDSSVVPDDPSRYTIEFATDGSVAVRADCNRGFGTYAEAAGALTIEVSGLTRAQCEEGSLSDEYLRDLVDVRTYVIEGGALYLDLMADAGTLRHGQG
jgi:heat shock protein HslJ